MLKISPFSLRLYLNTPPIPPCQFFSQQMWQPYSCKTNVLRHSWFCLCMLSLVLWLPYRSIYHVTADPSYSWECIKESWNLVTVSHVPPRNCSHENASRHASTKAKPAMFVAVAIFCQVHAAVKSCLAYYMCKREKFSRLLSRMRHIASNSYNQIYSWSFIYMYTHVRFVFVARTMSYIPK